MKNKVDKSDQKASNSLQIELSEVFTVLLYPLSSYGKLITLSHLNFPCRHWGLTESFSIERMISKYWLMDIQAGHGGSHL